MNDNDAAALATIDAAEAILIARASNDGPIEWITGNSYMPPLRAFGNAETVWQAPDADNDLWTAYFETFEKLLDDASVYLGCPEYDNSLYVVDLLRWEFIDEPDLAETLTEEWQPRDTQGSEKPPGWATPFRVCEDCGDSNGLKLIVWDGKDVPMCADCRDVHGIDAK